jgi:hypothetical protein
MKTLQFQRDEGKQKITVPCADGNKSVYSYCGYCGHCKGIWVKSRLVPIPQAQALADVKRGVGADENLMNAAMLFNTHVRDGTAIECDDDTNSGFVRRY